MNVTKQTTAHITFEQMQFFADNPELLYKYQSYYEKMQEDGKSYGPLITPTDDGVFARRFFVDQAAADEYLQFCATEIAPVVPGAEVPTVSDYLN